MLFSPSSMLMLMVFFLAGVDSADCPADDDGDASLTDRTRPCDGDVANDATDDVDGVLGCCADCNTGVALTVTARRADSGRSFDAAGSSSGRCGRVEVEGADRSLGLRGGGERRSAGRRGLVVVRVADDVELLLPQVVALSRRGLRVGVGRHPEHTEEESRA